MYIILPDWRNCPCSQIASSFLWQSSQALLHLYRSVAFANRPRFHRATLSTMESRMDLIIPANAATRLKRRAYFCGSDLSHFLDRSYSRHCRHGQEQVAVFDQVHPPCPRHRWKNAQHLCCFPSRDERALTDTGVL